MGGGVIDAGDDGGGVCELVLFEGSVEGLLDDFFVGGVGGVLGASQDLVAVAGGIEAGLVVLSAFPVVVEVSEPLVDLEVVEGDVGDDLLLDD